MSIDHWRNDAANSLPKVACLFSLFFMACGGGSNEAVCGDRVCDSSETASSCAADCGCGNNVANPGEECDGPDLGGGTCMAQVQRGGTLRCNADCTFDVSACTLASCGNGVAEDGEACDGADLGGGSCTSIGYAGGGLGCGIDCVYDTTTCCTDTCSTAGKAECVGDTLRECVAAASGCLAWQVTDCAASNDICEISSGAATCSCVDRCAAVGDKRCEGATIETCADVGGCLDWMATTNCGDAGDLCAVAASGPICVPDASAEDCSDPYPLSPGENVVAWTALNADYLTSQPSCNTTTLDGPDLVLSYTAPADAFIRFTLNKPASSRQVFVVSSAACGTVTPELACMSDSTPTSLSSELGVTAGVTYYFYVRDTTSGSPLDNPLLVSLDQTLCSAMDPGVTSVSPANGARVPDLTPILTAELQYPIDPRTGVITLTGNLGTNRTYDLATGPSEIAVINDGKTLVIDPGIVFPAGETVTVTWSGLYDATCAVVVDPPTWTFEVQGPPCTPGQNGMVGSTMTRVATGISESLTEYYVAADTNPAGYIYFGGTSGLYRTPKAGGTTQSVSTAAGLTSSHLGYDMLVDGDQIYTLEATTTAVTSNLLWQLSTDGGATWNKQSYMQLPQQANDDMRAITSYEGRYYMTTDESTDGVQIWSVAAGSTTLPQVVVLETTIPDERNCNGIALDDKFYYLACYNDDRIIRVDRVTLAKELITDAFDANLTKGALHAHDFDSDGRADALYFSGYYEEVDYVCSPSGTGPFFVGVLANFGSGTSNYGLGFDRVNNVLWMYDDDTKELVKLE